MAKSRLHELSEKGQSVWIDSLSREWLRDGTLNRLIDEDAVVGVTSNPTIFQKAMARGRLVRRPAAGGAAAGGRPARDLLAARGRRHPGGARPVPPGLGRGQGARTATSRSRSTPTSPTTGRRRSSRRMRLHEWVDRPNLFVKIPATEPGLGAIEECIARGQSINVTLIFSLDALRRGRRGVHPRARAARRVGRRPATRRVGRVVLRLARRHRGRQAPRRDRPREA